MQCRNWQAKFRLARILRESYGNCLSRKLRKAGCIACGSTNRRTSLPIVTATVRMGQGRHERRAQNRAGPPVSLLGVAPLAYFAAQRRGELPRLWEMQQS